MAKGKANMKTTTGTLVKRGKTYSARWTIAGKVFTKTTGKTNHAKALAEMKRIVAPFVGVGEVEALERVSARLVGRKAEVERLEAEANPPPEIGTIVNRGLVSPVWLAFIASTGRPDSGEATLRQYESEFKRFAEWLSAKRPRVKYLHEVTVHDAEDYARNLNEARVSASTYNQHRNFLRLLWRVLKDRAQLPVNVWDGITGRKLNRLATRKQVLTPAQFDALLHASGKDRDLHDLFMVLAWTGQRLVDGVMLKWGAVDYASGVITLAPRKTARRQGKIVTIPIFPATREVLNRREKGKPVNPSGYVFPALVEMYDRDPSMLTKRIKDAFQRAGMDTTEERADRERGVTVFGAHSLRHLAVTAFTSAGMPAAMIKSITGHSTDEQLEHYQQLGVAMAGEIAARMTAKTLPETPTIPLLSDSRPLRSSLLALIEAHGLDAVQSELQAITAN